MEEELLKWYRIYQRDLPWRRNTTAYSTWISEIMCQQTRIETVIPYYQRFMKRFPTVVDLAQSTIDEVLKLWQGLGYYSRGRNIFKTAQIIVDKYQATFPNTYKELIQLPGIGTYTAGAILSMAYELPYAAIDGNALRVFARYFKDDKDIKKEETKKYWKQKIEKMDLTNYGLFNQAIMDLGAMICLPNELPKCGDCPLKESCLAHLYQEEQKYPVKSRGIEKKQEEYTVFLIQLDDKILLHKRPNKGLLAGLYEFKNELGYLSIEEVKSKFKDQLIRISKGPTKTHVFTHKKWMMHSYILKLSEYTLGKDEFFYDWDTIDQELSIPQAFLQFMDVFQFNG